MKVYKLPLALQLIQKRLQPMPVLLALNSKLKFVRLS